MASFQAHPRGKPAQMSPVHAVDPDHCCGPEFVGESAVERMVTTTGIVAVVESHEFGIAVRVVCHAVRLTTAAWRFAHSMPATWCFDEPQGVWLDDDRHTAQVSVFLLLSRRNADADLSREAVVVLQPVEGEWSVRM